MCDVGVGGVSVGLVLGAAVESGVDGCLHICGGGDEVKVWGRWVSRGCHELGVELDSQVELESKGLLQLDALDTASLTQGRIADTAEDDTSLLHLLEVLHVELVAMTVTLLVDLLSITVDALDDGGRVSSDDLLLVNDVAITSSKTHVGAHGALVDLGHVDDDLVLALRLELLAVAAWELEEVTGDVDHSDLHSKANSEVRNVALTSNLSGTDLSVHTTLSKASSDEDTVNGLKLGLSLHLQVLSHLLSLLLRGNALEVGAVNPKELDSNTKGNAAVLEGLKDREVGISAVLEVFTNESNLNHLGGVAKDVAELLKGVDIGEVHGGNDGGEVVVEVELVTELIDDALISQKGRDVVKRLQIMGSEDVLGLNAAKLGQLLFSSVLDDLLAATHEEVSSEAQGEQSTAAVLSGLSLLGTSHDGEIGTVHKAEVLRGDGETECTEGLDEGGGLQVTNGASELDEADLRGLTASIDRNTGDALDVLHDLIGEVRDEGNCLTQEFTLTLALDQGVVDLTSGDVVLAGKGGGHPTLVVSEVQIDLSSISENVHLTVLEGGHQASIYVNVGVDLDAADTVSVGA